MLSIYLNFFLNSESYSYLFPVSVPDCVHRTRFDPINTELQLPQIHALHPNAQQPHDILALLQFLPEDILSKKYQKSQLTLNNF